MLLNFCERIGESYYNLLTKARKLGKDNHWSSHPTKGILLPIVLDVGRLSELTTIAREWAWTLEESSSNLGKEGKWQLQVLHIKFVMPRGIFRSSLCRSIVDQDRLVRDWFQGLVLGGVVLLGKAQWCCVDLLLSNGHSVACPSGDTGNSNGLNLVWFRVVSWRDWFAE